MTTTQILQQTRRRLGKLSAEKLKVAADFVAYLDEREDNEATKELLRIPGFSKAYEKAKREARTGRLVTLNSALRKR
jgi:hypothetical protein